MVEAEAVDVGEDLDNFDFDFANEVFGADNFEHDAKIAFLRKFLPALIEKQHKVILFSSSTRMLDVVFTLVLKPLGIKSLRLDG